jgi:four helix bundle protein
VQDFKKLQVWQKGRQLTLAVYKATARFPSEELYGLTSQIRRACASIPANIAEGCGRAERSDLARFLQVAAGSASELHYHLILAHDLSLFTGPQFRTFEAETIGLKRMLASLIEKVRREGKPTPSRISGGPDSLTEN